MSTFNASGVNLYYEVKGDPNSKSAVAFLNGVMASTNSWDLISPIFEKLGFKVILHDFKGQLKSDKPAGPYTFAEHSTEAKALFEHLGVEKIHLVGTSYGSEVAMKFAILFPDMVESLSIICGVSEIDEVLKGFIDNWEILCDLNDGEKFFWGMAPIIYGNSFYVKNFGALKERAKASRALPKEYFEGQKTLYKTFKDDVYMTNGLYKIKCPALIIAGQEDLLKRTKFSDIIAREIPNTEYVILPDCGHVAIFEQYKVLNTLLSGFILKNN
ncbi:MAG: alpha/beta hydrolase [Tissierellales bacterium]